MSDDVKLTPNAIKILYETKDIVNPIVQILGSCYCDFMNDGPIYKCTRRCFIISDGKTYYHAFLASKYQCIEYENILKPLTIMKLTSFNNKHKICERPFILILDAETLNDSNDEIYGGHPQDHESLELKTSRRYGDRESKYYEKLDQLATMIETMAGQIPEEKDTDICIGQQIINAFSAKEGISDEQKLHIKHGMEDFQKARDIFDKYITGDDFITPKMALSIEHGRNLMNPTLLESFFKGEVLIMPSYIQIVTYCRIYDKKKEGIVYLLLNDGVQMSTGILCPYNTKKLLYSGNRIKKYSLVQINKYSCMKKDDDTLCFVIHDIVKHIDMDCIIRYTKSFPTYSNHMHYTEDDKLEILITFCKSMEQEGVKAHGFRSTPRTEKIKPFKVKKMKQHKLGNLPSPESVISVGAIEKLANGIEVKNPILQVLLCRKILQKREYRFAVLLSDGYDIMTAAVDPQLFLTAPKMCFQPLTLIEISKYSFLKIVLYRNILYLHKLGYIIPVSNQNNKKIGNPVYYTQNVEYSAEELQMMPKFSPHQTIEIVTHNPKKFLQQQRFPSVTEVLTKDIKIVSNPTTSVSSSEPDSVLKSEKSRFPPPVRTPAQDGFCLHADKWHMKGPQCTSIPDGRILIRKPSIHAVPFKVSVTGLPKHMHSKVIIK